MGLYAIILYALQVDIAGSLYYWGLSINTVTAVLLVLVVGLSVDYAAHVAHAFMRAIGSRKGIVSQHVMCKCYGYSVKSCVAYF